ncbi:hypothetical protein [Kribbella solani]|uniref:Uncharacterized protein n=1 Tax=Kribbella solani TaxID=236067 RepID=A0A841E3K4_9ACTN|nr:hypothetical protein [Kribbella solani]MBB5983585.1 hypothetical protein [Kribbella solani]
MIAVALSLAPAVAAIADQAGGRSLFNHASSAYAAYGKTITSGTVYGLMYGVAAFNLLLWLLVVALARTPRLIAAGAAVTAVLLTITAALALLLVTEYGVHPFPPLWGILALLPATAGALAVAALARPPLPA